MNISFRALEDSDLELMFHWLQQPHVKEWWNDGDDTIDKVKAHYFESKEHVERFMLLSEENEEVGYFQCYMFDENTVGIDQFLGDENCINVGLGTKAVKLFTDLVFENFKPDSIILDPDPDNRRAIRCYEKAGFAFYELKKSAIGMPAYMMRLSGKLSDHP